MKIAVSIFFFIVSDGKNDFQVWDLTLLFQSRTDVRTGSFQCSVIAKKIPLLSVIAKKIPFLSVIAY